MNRICVSLAAFISFAHLATAMEWDTSAVIAEFRDQHHFHQDSQKLVAVLAAQNIKAVVTESGPPVINVALADESHARRIMAAAIKKYHLHVTPVHEPH